VVQRLAGDTAGIGDPRALVRGTVELAAPSALSSIARMKRPEMAIGERAGDLERPTRCAMYCTVKRDASTGSLVDEL
jgi:hypothetical protein